MVIEQCRRHHLLAWMLLPFQFHGCIHIHHKLQLQSIVKGGNVEFFLTRFIVNDFHIHMGVILRHINPVYPSPQGHFLLVGQFYMHTFQVIRRVKRHLHGIGKKAPLFQLALEGQYRPDENPLHAVYGIGVPGTAVEHCLPIGCRIGLQDIPHCPFCIFLREIEPSIPCLCQLPGKLFQHCMVHISHVHGLEGEPLPLPQEKPVLQEMAVSAGCVCLQPGDTVFQEMTVKRPGHYRRQAAVLVPQKSCLLQHLPLVL